MVCHQMTSEGRRLTSSHHGLAPRTRWVPGRLRRMVTASAVAAVALATSIVAPIVTGVGTTNAGAGTPPTVTQNFGFDDDTLQTFTVPANVTALTLTMTGGQGGWGGTDSSGRRRGLLLRNREVPRVRGCPPPQPARRGHGRHA